MPDCDACTPPLLPENRDAVMIFQIIQGQMLVSAMGGPYDVNHLAIHEAMRLYDVPNRRDCFEKVLMLVHKVLLKEK